MSETPPVSQNLENTLHEWVRAIEGTMVSIVDVFEETLEFLVSNKGQQEPDMSFDQLFAALENPISIICDNAKQFTLTTSHTLQLQEWQQLQSEIIDRSERLTELLDRTTAIRNAVIWPKQVQVSSKALANAAREYSTKETLRTYSDAIQQSTHEIDRLVCLYDLLKIRPIVNALRQKASRMRRSIHSSEIEQSQPTVIDITSMIKSICKEFHETARRKKVEIREHTLSKSAKIRGSKDDIYTALSNLVDNAIKYSSQINSHYSNPLASWVDIRIKTNFAHVIIEIENWGIPISREEIQTGVIFGEGIRGNEAINRGISGTGMGLHFAKKAIEDHAGSLDIKSWPARKDTRHTDLSRPYITTVTIRFPRL